MSRDGATGREGAAVWKILTFRFAVEPLEFWLSVWTVVKGLHFMRPGIDFRSSMGPYIPVDEMTREVLRLVSLFPGPHGVEIVTGLFLVAVGLTHIGLILRDLRRAIDGGPIGGDGRALTGSIQGVFTISLFVALLKSPVTWAATPTYAVASAIWLYVWVRLGLRPRRRLWRLRDLYYFGGMRTNKHEEERNGN